MCQQGFLSKLLVVLLTPRHLTNLKIILRNIPLIFDYYKYFKTKQPAHHCVEDYKRMLNVAMVIASKKRETMDSYGDLGETRVGA